MNYFDHIKTRDALKKQYRDYCKFMHPDKGGKHEKFVEMKRQYETWQPPAKKVKKQSHKKYADEHTAMKTVIITALKKEMKRRKRKNVTYAKGNVVYTVNVNEFFNKILDKLF